MSTDIEDLSILSEELEELKGKFQSTLLESRRKKGSDKSKCLKDADELMNKFKKKYRRFKRKIKETSSQEDLAEYEKKKKTFGDEISKMGAHLEEERMRSEREVLMEEASEKKESGVVEKREKKKADVLEVKTSENSSKYTKDKELADMLFKDVFKLQKEQLDCLQRIEGMVDDSQQLANQAGEMLAKQGEQLKAIDGELDTLQSNIKRAGKEITSFARGVARQKIIYIIIAGILVAVLVVIIVLIVQRFIPRE